MAIEAEVYEVYFYDAYDWYARREIITGGYCELLSFLQKIDGWHNISIAACGGFVDWSILHALLEQTIAQEPIWQRKDDFVTAIWFGTVDEFFKDGPEESGWINAQAVFHDKPFGEGNIVNPFLEGSAYAKRAEELWGANRG